MWHSDSLSARVTLPKGLAISPLLLNVVGPTCMLAQSLSAASLNNTGAQQCDPEESQVPQHGYNRLE